MSQGGTVLSLSSYDIEDENTFVEFYDLDELFYTKCVIDDPGKIDKNGICNSFSAKGRLLHSSSLSSISSGLSMVPASASVPTSTPPLFIRAVLRRRCG